MQAIPIVLAVAGTALKAGGSIAAGKHNKKILYQQARDELATTTADTQRMREESRRAIGEQLSAQWSNGFEGGTGTALDALRESQINAALDVMERRRQGVARAASLEEEGRMANRKGKLDAVGALIDGASSVFGMKADWAQARQGSSVPSSY